jgi:hypothetical protein
MVAIVTLIFFYDIARLILNKRFISGYKYQISHISTIPTLVFVIIGFLYDVYGLIKYFTFGEQDLTSLLILAIVCIDTFFHITQKSIICDKGVWFIGYLYRWREIKSYLWDKDINYITFSVINKIYKNENKIRFRIIAGKGNEIDKYLEDKLN